MFDSTGKLIARNDDYYGNDSFLQLQLTAGTYYVAVTSTGNTNFDPDDRKHGFRRHDAGRYQLRLTFTPDVPRPASRTRPARCWTATATARPAASTTSGSAWPTRAHTIFVDKAATGGTGTLGSITNPYTTISDGLGRGHARQRRAHRRQRRRRQEPGHDRRQSVLQHRLRQPRPRAVRRLEVRNPPRRHRDDRRRRDHQAARAPTSTSARRPRASTAAAAPCRCWARPPRTPRAPTSARVYFTSYYNTAIGTDPNTAKGTLASGNWGGLVFRDDSDLESSGIFLNSVNHANISYGGGKVVVNSVQQHFDPIHLVTSRPTISFNTITHSANAAISADPNSFQESEFQGTRTSPPTTPAAGPTHYGNHAVEQQHQRPVRAHPHRQRASLDPLTVSARFSTTDMVYVIKENLDIAGQPGGYVIDSTGRLTARPNARLAIDPGVIVKLGGARIETADRLAVHRRRAPRPSRSSSRRSSTIATARAARSTRPTTANGGCAAPKAIGAGCSSARCRSPASIMR